MGICMFAGSRQGEIDGVFGLKLRGGTGRVD